MKLLMLSFALVGAGGIAIGSGNINIVDTRTPAIFNMPGESKTKGAIETFMHAPHSQCVARADLLDINSIVSECLNYQRKWLKAI